MNTADQLIAGYTAYTDAGELGATAVGQAPASTPVLSIIAQSTLACGGAVSAASTASVGFTIHIGC
jgi:hypothetical protein